MKLPDAPFYPLADLARECGCSVDMLRIFAEHGAANGQKLPIGKAIVGGVEIEVVTREAREAFAGAPGPTRPMSESVLSLIGLLAAYCGGDARNATGHYALCRDLAGFAERAKLPFPRGKDTYSSLIKAGLAALQAGVRSTRNPSRPDTRRAKRKGLMETPSAPERRASGRIVQPLGPMVGDDEHPISDRSDAPLDADVERTT